jgi:tetratricopeptide (TPR) repeat protein
LRRALEYDWLANGSQTNEGVAFFFDRARLWRSWALVARPETEPEAWRKVGFTATSQENYKLAIEAFTEAISLSPINSGLYLGRGDAYLALGKQQLQAYRYFRTSRIETRPNGPDDSLLRPYALAILDFSKAIELEPGSAVGYNGRGTAHAAMRDETSAISDYRKSIDLDPNYIRA